MRSERADGMAAALMLSLVVSGPAVGQTETEGPDAVDPEAYVGLWYELARTPTPFQEQCRGGVTAFYEVTGPKTLSILNQCDLPDGEVSRSKGTAQATDGKFGWLEVEFEQSPGDGGFYVVEATGPANGGKYQWAAVTAGEGRFGWILARSLDLDNEARQEAEGVLEGAGMNPANLQAPEQPPRNYDPEQE